MVLKQVHITLIAAVVLCGCHKTQTEEGVDITIEWQDHPKDVDVGPLSVSGSLLTSSTDKPYKPTAVTSSEKVIDGKIWRGERVYKDSYAAEHNPADALLDAVQFRESPSRIRLHISCKVPVQVKIENFTGGTLLDVHSKEKLPNPAKMLKGEYDLDAVKQ
ncbi:MAG: hypothetical protein WCI73_03805 [Phycisphaerae bacterium]